MGQKRDQEMILEVVRVLAAEVNPEWSGIAVKIAMGRIAQDPERAGRVAEELRRSILLYSRS